MTTVINSFEEKLSALNSPPLPLDMVVLDKPLDKIRNKVRDSSKSGLDTKPLAVVVRETTAWYETMWSIYAPKPEYGAMLQTTLPYVPKTYLRCEGDVATLAEKLIINGIDIALQALCNHLVVVGSLRVGSEIRKSVEHQEANCRPDIRWEICWPASPLDPKSETLRDTLAILDFKCPYAINEKDFETGTIDDTTQLASKIVQARREKSKTLLSGEAAELSKKANKYAKICPLVAIFDWHKLVVFELPVGLNDAGLPVGGHRQLRNEQIQIAQAIGVPHDNYVRAMVFDEKTAENGMTFRKMIYTLIVQRLQDWYIQQSA